MSLFAHLIAASSNGIRVFVQGPIALNYPEWMRFGHALTNWVNRRMINPSLVAGTKYRGEFEERMEAVVILSALRERLEKHHGVALPTMRVGREEIAAVVAARRGFPLVTLTADEGERLKRLEGALSGRVKRQPEAISAVADAVRLARVGLKKPKRPAGVFLFVGVSSRGIWRLGLDPAGELSFHAESRSLNA